MTTTIIDVRGATKRFGEIHAVDDVDLAVREGEIFGLIGHNGAGKSTLIRMLLGLLPPDRGDIRIAGEPVGGPRFREVRRGIAYLPENVVFYDNLSGLETLRFFAELKGADTRSCRALLEKVGLGHAAGRSVRGYSKGMHQRLGFAQALLGDPRLLFLDEPTTGLDPAGIREFYDMLGELRQRGVTVILSSHHLAEIQERVDRLALMRLGRIQALGTVQEMVDQLPPDPFQRMSLHVLDQVAEAVPLVYVQPLHQLPSLHRILVMMYDRPRLIGNAVITHVHPPSQVYVVEEVFVNAVEAAYFLEDGTPYDHRGRTGPHHLVIVCV